MQLKMVRAAIAASVVVLWALPASAGLFDDDEARKQIVQLRTQVQDQQRVVDQRLTELETQSKNRSIDLSNQVEILRAEFAKLRGQLELLQNELENTQKRQRDLYVDLDGRMRKMETAQEATKQELAKLAAAASATPASPTNAPSSGAGAIMQLPVVPDPSRAVPTAVLGQPQAPLQVLPSSPSATPSLPPASAGVPTGDPAREQAMYDQGLEHFRAGRFGEAVTAFQLFMRSYPRSQLASSAQYWIGNSLFATRDYRGAITAQRQLLTQYPESNKAPDALLNISTSQAELGDLQGARASLQEVVAKYPTSEAAGKARQRLGIR